MTEDSSTVLWTPVPSDPMAIAALAIGRDRTWAVKMEGEVLFQMSGPDAERIARLTAEREGGTVAYCEDVRPTQENGYTLHGPWIDVP